MSLLNRRRDSGFLYLDLDTRVASNSASGSSLDSDIWPVPLLIVANVCYEQDCFKVPYYLHITSTLVHILQETNDRCVIMCENPRLGRCLNLLLADCLLFFFAFGIFSKVR